ncbi:hypothetical protein SGLAM104S_05438 [Streptomyces glaucescens]
MAVRGLRRRLLPPQGPAFGQGSRPGRRIDRRRCRIPAWADHNGANQQFRLADSDAGHVRLLNRTSGKAVEVQGASTADGANVVQYTDWGGANQQWQMIKLSSGGGGGCGSAPTLTSGTHTIQSGGKSRSFILRVPANYDNSRPYRLIFALHWRGGTAGDVASRRLRGKLVLGRSRSRLGPAEGSQ